jgi:lipoyl(octanoyl) transferase
MPDVPEFTIERLGRVPYADALELQRARHAEVLAGRTGGAPHRILLVEHPAVITVTRRPGAGEHVLADSDALAAAGVERCETDRGGDVTYHGPGQAVAYPIVDLQRLGLGIHAYIRALEEAAIRTCAAWGIRCAREEGATGVWAGEQGSSRKIAAIGVRVSRSVTLHGIALNVDPDLSHFGLIVPCGLHGRAVTSMRREVGAACPVLEDASTRLGEEIAAALTRPSAKAP